MCVGSGSQRTEQNKVLLCDLLVYMLTSPFRMYTISTGSHRSSRKSHLFMCRKVLFKFQYNDQYLFRDPKVLCRLYKQNYTNREHPTNQSQAGKTATI